jgi:hypothetical protein
MSNKKHTIESCKEYAISRGYILKEDSYINPHNKMTFLHSECQTVFETNWNRFFNRGSGCPVCANKKNGERCRADINFQKSKAIERGYVILSEEWVISCEKYIFKHDFCGFEFEMTWNNFNSQKQGCPACSGVMKLTMEYCKSEAMKRGYLLKDKTYKNASTKMVFIHEIDNCNFEFSMKWGDFHQGHGCPACANRQIESGVAKVLKTYFKENYGAIKEYGNLKNPKTGFSLPFDIYLEVEGIKYFIEVQGLQHYKFISHFHKTKENFKYSQHKDKIKKEYAEQNGTFIEIDLRKKKITTEEWIQFIEIHF